MTRHRHILNLVLTFALLMSALGRLPAQWFCEGRVCSASVWRCCCASPRASQDAQCAKSGPSVSKGCEGECGCQVKVSPDAGTKAWIRVTEVKSLPALSDPDLGDLPSVDLSPKLPLPAFLAWRSPQVRPLPPPCPISPRICPPSPLRAPPTTA